jgi:hypothetical protein
MLCADDSAAMRLATTGVDFAKVRGGYAMSRELGGNGRVVFTLWEGDRLQSCARQGRNS